MHSAPTSGLILSMQPVPVPSRIAVRVRPPVFAETLARALGRPDLELVLSPATIADDQGYDGALVSRSAPEEAAGVAVVIRIPDPQDDGVGLVITVEGEREVRLHTLEAIRGLVEELWPRTGG